MRYIEPYVAADLAKKMVFVGGPRQSGKTYLAKALLQRTSGEYLNWDDPRDRRRIQKHEFDTKLALVVFDELHKMVRWKQWIKGLFDTRTTAQNYLVTGSARLDVYRRGGDSLVGRYHYWRLHPFTLDEPIDGMTSEQCLDRLMSVGGFPEPFLSGVVRDSQRWRRERFDRILRDDIRDLENIRMMASLESLIDLLKQRVGSQIAFANLARDLEIAPKTVKHWIEILERMYLIFSVLPYTGKVSRAIQRPPRIYFYDNMDVDVADDRMLGARFENLVATHLLKRLQFMEDNTGERWELRYLRDRDDREVDFVVVRNRQVEELIEVKYSDTVPSPSLVYYAKKLQPKRSTQIVFKLDKERTVGDVRVVSAIDYFSRNIPWRKTADD